MGLPSARPFPATLGVTEVQANPFSGKGDAIDGAALEEGLIQRWAQQNSCLFPRELGTSLVSPFGVCSDLVQVTGPRGINAALKDKGSRIHLQ